MPPGLLGWTAKCRGVYYQIDCVGIFAWLFRSVVTHKAKIHERSSRFRSWSVKYFPSCPKPGGAEFRFERAGRLKTVGAKSKVLKNIKCQIRLAKSTLMSGRSAEGSQKEGGPGHLGEQVIP